MLQDRHEAGFLAVDVDHVGLGLVTVGDFCDIAEQHGHAFAYANRQTAELLDEARARIELDVVFAFPDAGDAGRNDDVRCLHRVDNIGRRQAFGAELGRVDVDDDLALFTAEGRRHGQSGNSEQLEAEEVQAIIEDLLLGQRLARQRHLHDRNVRGVELKDIGRGHARRGDAQD